MQSIGDLSWLQYVCYGVWAAAAALFFSARTDVSGIRKPLKIAAACICIFVGMSTWSIQEHHSQFHSPRAITTGVVAWVTENHYRNGSFSDDFELYLPGGGISPKFSSGTFRDSNSARPIARGDVLRVEYRVWDKKAVGIQELRGSHAGWQYRYPPEGWWMFYVGATVAAGGLMWLFTQWRRRREGEELIHDDDLPAQPQEIQTLGLEIEDQQSGR